MKRRDFLAVGGALLAARGETAQAAAAFSRALELRPGMPDAMRRLAGAP